MYGIFFFWGGEKKNLYKHMYGYGNEKKIDTTLCNSMSRRQYKNLFRIYLVLR